VSDERDNGRERPRSAADRRGRRASSGGSSADGASVTGGKGRATPTRGAATATKRPSVIARLVRFLREVVAELRKVIWPTRNQLVTYTIVVLVFVTFMVALVSLLDWVFGLGVQALFGS
jgi:preprotein translocase subunit SecE